MIRKLNHPKWIAPTTDLIKDYAFYLGFGEHFKWVHAAKSIETMDLCLIWTIGEEVHGVIGGRFSPSPWNPETKTFHEEIYYITPTARGKGVGRELITAFIEELDDVDAEMITMKLMFNSPQVEALYEEHGFSKLETTYIRR